MGMEQAQHTPWEISWQNMEIMVKGLKQNEWMTKSWTKSVFGETFTMYL